MKAAGLITVAGQSLRMGAFKPLLPIDGKPMISRTADVFAKAGVADLFVVLGKRGEEIVSALRDHTAYDSDIRFLWNNAFEETEMFASVQIGLDAICREGGFDAAFVLPGDMPAVPPDMLFSLATEMSRGGWDVVFPSDGARRLHPPLIAASCFDPIVAYAGEDGLRGAFRKMRCSIGYVVTEEPGCRIDVDTPEDYAYVQKCLTSRNGGEDAK